MQSPSKNRHKALDEKPRKGLLQIKQKETLFQAKGLSASISSQQNFLSNNELQHLLTEYNIPTSQVEITKVLETYGKNNNLPISSLKNTVFSKHNPVTRSFTISPGKRNLPFNIEKSILDRSTEISLQNHSVSLHNFFQSIECRLRSYDLIIDYFFLSRGEKISFEEFNESCVYLIGTEFDLHGIFNELADKGLSINKQKFLKVFESVDKGESDGVEVVRAKMKKKFGSFVKGFETLKKNGRVYSSELFSLFGVKTTPVELPAELPRYDFKKFWFDKENICKVDFCVGKIKEYEFCDTHFKGFILRGEETLRKITAMNSPERSLPVINNLLTCLNKRLPFTQVNIQKRDVQALQIYLKYKQDKKLLSLNSSPC